MDERPAGLRHVDPLGLSAFLRALLTIDGTVTQFIEAYTAERVRIALLDQHGEAAGAAARWLDCDPADDALRRRSLLLGASSGRLYAYAESLIVPGRLPAAMRDGLATEPGGLGKIIVDSALETRRECLWFGEDVPRADLPPDLVPEMPAAFLTRSYRILAAGQPMMQITEHFPRDLDHPG